MPTPRHLVARTNRPSSAGSSSADGEEAADRARDGSDATLPVRRRGALIADPRSARALAGGRRPALDFQRLVHNVEALRVPQRLGGVLQLVSACTGEGVSTVAAEYAKCDAEERREQVLLLDCGILATQTTRPIGSNHMGAYEAFQAGTTDLASVADTRREYRGVLWAPLAYSTVSLIGGGHARMTAFLDAARAQFPLTLLDCPPVLDCPQSAAMARLCDGTVIVVRAGQTLAEDVKAAQQQIEDQGGLVLGVVFNRRQRYLPRFLSPRG